MLFWAADFLDRSGLGFTGAETWSQDSEGVQSDAGLTVIGQAWGGAALVTGWIACSALSATFPCVTLSPSGAQAGKMPTCGGLMMMLAAAAMVALLLLNYLVEPHARR
jgi:hypothetical protein